MNPFDRLHALKAENDSFRLQMSEESERFEQLRNRKENGITPRAVSSFNLFQTPRTIAQRMAQIIQERAGDDCRILEPSAGLGRLFEPLEALRAEWIMVEEVGECCNALRKSLKRVKEVRQADFLGQTADGLGGKFDCVVMNPPFKQGRDIKHILHALEMVRDGGRLVSLCYNGTRQNENLKPYATRWEVLPEASFKEEGTSASVALLVIDK
jgi:predicted RNA methylase